MQDELRFSEIRALCGTASWFRLGLLDQRKLLIRVTRTALPLRHLHAIGGRAGIVETKAALQVDESPKPVPQRLWLPFLIGISGAVAPELDRVTVRRRAVAVVPNQRWRIAVVDRIITDRKST